MASLNIMAIFKPINISIDKFKHIIKKRTGADVDKYINNKIIYYFMNRYGVWISFINDVDTCVLLSNSNDILKRVCEKLDMYKMDYKYEKIKKHIMEYYQDLFINNPLFIPV